MHLYIFQYVLIYIEYVLSLHIVVIYLNIMRKYVAHA